MGSRIYRPGVGFPPPPGASGVDTDGNPYDPYPGPTLGDVVDGVKDGIGHVQEIVRPQSQADADAKAEPDARTREVDCSKMSDETACNECALKQGYIDKPKSGRYVTRRNIINYDYQLYIANLRSAPLRFSYIVADKADPERRFFSVDTIFDYLNRRGYSRTIQEWHFNACEFDGFWPDDCMVVEAKGNYDHFLDDNGDPKYFFVRSSVFEPWLAQMTRQKAAIKVAEPEGKLQWCFMQEMTRQAGINFARIDPSICERIPMPGKPE